MFHFLVTEPNFEASKRGRKSLYWKIFWLVFMLILLTWLWYRLFTKTSSTYEDFQNQSNQSVQKVENDAILLDGLMPENSENVVKNNFGKIDEKEKFEAEKNLKEKESENFLQEFKDKNFSWKNLSEKFQKIIFNSNFSFQGKMKKFSEVFPENSKFYESLKVEDVKKILNGEILMVNDENLTVEIKDKIQDKIKDKIEDKIKDEIQDKNEDFEDEINDENQIFKDKISQENLDEIQKFNDKIQNFYIDRQFIPFNAQLYSMSWDYFTQKLTSTPNSVDIFNFEGILDEIKDTKIFLLADKIGSGKTSTLKEFEKKLKNKSDSWVSWIDLKLNADKIEEILSLKNESKKFFLNFLTSEILKIPEGPSKSAFEYFYDKKRVNFIIDELNDEKSIKFVLKIQNLTEISQFISTSPQLASNFNSNSAKSFKFFPLTKEDRENFIQKFLETSKLKKDEQKEIQKKISKFIEKMNSKSSLGEEKSLNSPKMLKIIAEAALREEKNFDFQNIYQVYENFVEKILMRNLEQNEGEEICKNKF